MDIHTLVNEDLFIKMIKNHKYFMANVKYKVLIKIERNGMFRTGTPGEICYSDFSKDNSLRNL